MFTVFLIMLVAVGGVLAFTYTRSRKRDREQKASELALVKKAAAEDVTQFGEEVTELDVITAGVELDEGGRQDYQRALDHYEDAKSTLDRITEPDDIRHVTTVLEDGRYAAACVQARVEGRPLPTRRPPCFFNPQHGPSTQDVDWAPAGGQPRPVPVCAADAERVEVGAEPAVRKVDTGDGMSRRAYWEAGPAYAPYNQGYYSSFAGSGLLPGVLMGAMLFGGFGGGGWDGAGDAGGADFGGDAGGDVGGDAGGDLGGFDFGGGGDGGGFDFGGFDF